MPVIDPTTSLDAHGEHPEQPDSPTVWRRWLAFELSRLRDETGLTQKEVGDALRPRRMSHVTISKIENAQVSLNSNTLEALLDVYDVTDDIRTACRLANDRAQKPGWWDRFEPGEYPRWFSLYLGLEQGARRLQAYHPTLIHGLLQTPQYARAMLTSGHPTPRTKPQVERLVRLRMGRQQVITQKSLELSLVLDEGAIRRIIGGREIMADQLRFLAAATDEPNVDLRVIPFARGAAVHESGFTILEFESPDDPGIVYIEARGNAWYLDERAEVTNHQIFYDYLCASALDPEHSVEFIRQAANEMMGS